VTGGSLPALVWRDIMAKAHAGLPERQLPGIEMKPPEIVIAENDAGDALEQEPEVAQSAPPRKRKKKNLLAIIFGGREDESEEQGLY
jgi:membrane peptidoglycan carboxypeptidase